MSEYNKIKAEYDSVCVKLETINARNAELKKLMDEFNKTAAVNFPNLSISEIMAKQKEFFPINKNAEEKQKRILADLMKFYETILVEHNNNNNIITIFCNFVDNFDNFKDYAAKYFGTQLTMNFRLEKSPFDNNTPRPYVDIILE
jgi:hypothetical protein